MRGKAFLIESHLALNTRTRRDNRAACIHVFTLKTQRSTFHCLILNKKNDRTFHVIAQGKLSTTFFFSPHFLTELFFLRALSDNHSRVPHDFFRLIENTNFTVYELIRCYCYNTAGALCNKRILNQRYKSHIC